MPTDPGASVPGGSDASGAPAPGTGRPLPPRTLLAHNGARIFGGAEMWTVRLLRGLQERGHRVLLLCRDDAMVERVEAGGVPAEVAHLGGHPAVHDAVRFAAALRRYRPDGLLLSTFKKTWLGGMGARLARVPRVVARIGLSTDLPGRSVVYRVAFRRWIDRVVVNADGLRAPVLAGLPDVDPARVITVYNGVEAPARRRPSGSLRRELGLARDVPLVGAVARLAAQKRLDRFLEVVAALPPEVQALLAGDGPERAALEARAAALGISERVRFLGHRDDVGDVLDALDVLLLTSDREGMSNAMLEALAAGVPVVSTPVSGAEEALGPFAEGPGPGVVAGPDVPALAEAVRRVIEDGRAGDAMARAAIRRVRDRFHARDKVVAWEALLGGDTMAVPHEGPSPLRPEVGRP